MFNYHVTDTRDWHKDTLSCDVFFVDIPEDSSRATKVVRESCLCASLCVVDVSNRIDLPIACRISCADTPR